MARIPKQRVIFDAEKYDLDYLRETRDSYSPITDADFEDSISYDMGEHDLRDLMEMDWRSNKKALDAFLGKSILVRYSPVNYDGGFVQFNLNDLDCHLPEDYLNGLLSRYGYSSLADFKSVNGEAWRDALTGIIAGNQEANRFEVPHLFPDPSAAERFCTYQGVPGDMLRPAMEKARAEYEKVKAHQSPEKAVSLKGEVETARGASAAMADNGNHSNRGQDAR